MKPLSQGDHALILLKEIWAWLLVSEERMSAGLISDAQVLRHKIEKVTGLDGSPLPDVTVSQEEARVLDAIMKGG